MKKYLSGEVWGWEWRNGIILLGMFSAQLKELLPFVFCELLRIDFQNCDAQAVLDPKIESGDLLLYVFLCNRNELSFNRI